MVTGPEVITRGWVYAAEAEDLLDECAQRVAEPSMDALEQGDAEVETLQRSVRRSPASS